MTAMLAYTVQHSLSGFISHHLQLLQIQLFFKSAGDFIFSQYTYFLYIYNSFDYIFNPIMIMISGCKDTKNPKTRITPTTEK